MNKITITTALLMINIALFAMDSDDSASPVQGRARADSFLAAPIATVHMNRTPLSLPQSVPGQIVAQEPVKERSAWLHKGDFMVLLKFKGPDSLFIDHPQEDHENPPQKEEELFNRSFCDLEKTAAYDDIGKYSLVQTSLFMQLFVQASRSDGARLAAFHELLAKIQNNDFEKIGTNEIKTYNNVLREDDEARYVCDNVPVFTNLVGITKRDLCHRLLACIPTGHTNSLINGKKVRLDLRQCETAADKIENIKIKAEHEKLPPQKFVWGQEIKGFYEYYQYSGQHLLADYFF